jgi:alkanesulfonate monooxygenase SsuD/methylene tetrahydromethanopterin reductase-like flavin-dependent oxidoreductase (luciferase family)
MMYGVSFLPDATAADKSAANYFRDALLISAQADALGIEYCKMTEHYLGSYGGYCPSPIAFLCSVAAITQRIRLMTGGILPLFHHPIQTAAETAMLDAISSGRAEIGFARAHLPYEFAAFGVPMDGSRDRFIETIQTIVRLWTEIGVDCTSSTFQFKNATSFPRCTQIPHPPIWVAAVQTRQSFAWIGQEGYNLLITPGLAGYDSVRELVSIYRETYSECWPDRRPQVGLSLPVYIDRDNSKAIEEADLLLGKYLAVWLAAVEDWIGLSSSDYPRYSGVVYGLRNDTPTSMRHRLAAIVGSPDHVVAQFRELQKLLGPDVLLMQVDFGAASASQALTTVDLFAREVRPCLS